MISCEWSGGGVLTRGDGDSRAGCAEFAGVNVPVDDDEVAALIAPSVRLALAECALRGIVGPSDGAFCTCKRKLGFTICRILSQRFRPGCFLLATTVSPEAAYLSPSSAQHSHNHNHLRPRNLRG
jgi:hypothetical protein